MSFCLGALLALLALLLAGFSSYGVAQTRIAVASNFAVPMQALIAGYSKTGGDPPALVTGSSGKLFVQIMHGLPVDAFFSADSERPRKLEAQGKASGRFTYALGKLVLVSLDPALQGMDVETVKSNSINHLAIANPQIAPYGLAAQQALQALGLWQSVAARIVYGENIGQTWQFVYSGHADAGIIALSQWQHWRQGSAAGVSWPIPQDAYPAVRQQAVVIRSGKAIAAFISFVRSRAGRNLIVSLGYGLPDH